MKKKTLKHLYVFSGFPYMLVAKVKCGPQIIVPLFFFLFQMYFLSDLRWEKTLMQETELQKLK